MNVWFYVAMSAWAASGVILAIAGAISLNEYMNAKEEDS